MITHERLLSVLSYDKTTGVFTWNGVGATKSVKGKRAGCLRPDGYRILRVDNLSYLEHRLALFYVDGVWPTDLVDHVNRIKSDNSYANLRESTRSQNLFNRTAIKTNRSKIKGVTWDASRNLWRARININGREIHLGRFKDLSSAEAAYKKCAIEYHQDFYCDANPTE